MSEVCSPNPVNTCDECAELELAQDDLVIQAGLAFPATYYLNVVDKFGHHYQVQVSTAADGSFTVDTASFPAGLFNEYAGSLELYLSTDADGINLVTMTISGVEYTCVDLQVLCCVGIGCMEIEADFIVS